MLYCVTVLNQYVMDIGPISAGKSESKILLLLTVDPRLQSMTYKQKRLFLPIIP